MYDAPLPDLLYTPESDGESARNSWRQLVDTVPVQAEHVRYNTTSPTSLPPAIRSPFRVGSLQFTATGILLDGQAVVGNAALMRIAGMVQFVFMLAYLVCSAGFLFGVLGAYGGWSVFFVFGGILIRGLAGFIQERHRLAMATEIPWSDVHGAQIDANGRWITLFFDMPVVAPDAKIGAISIAEAFRKTVFLSLNGLDAATITGVSATMRYYHPESRFVTLKAYEWTRGRKIALVIVSIPIALLIFVIFIFAWRSFFP